MRGPTPPSPPLNLDPEILTIDPAILGRGRAKRAVPATIFLRLKPNTILTFLPLTPSPSPDRISLVQTLAEYTEVLMPEGLCARCDEGEPSFWMMFSVNGFGEEELLTLGFCSNECFADFCSGAQAVKSLPGL